LTRFGSAVVWVRFFSQSAGMMIRGERGEQNMRLGIKRDTTLILTIIY